LLEVFLKHELAHGKFANPANKIRFFIHKNFSWLEEFLVSFGDVFRPLSLLKEESVGDLLAEHNGWIASTFKEIFPDGVGNLSQVEIERRFNNAISSKDVPEDLKNLSGYETTKLIQEYFRTLNDKLNSKTSDDLVNYLLRDYNYWIEPVFETIFPTGLEDLSPRDFEKKFNDFIKTNNTPEALKRLSGTVTTKLITEYFKRKGSPPSTQIETPQEPSKPLEKSAESARMAAAELEIYQAQSQLDQAIFEQTKDSQENLAKPASQASPLGPDTIQAREDARVITEIAIESVRTGNITVGNFDTLKMILSRLMESVPERYRKNEELEEQEFTTYIKGSLRDGDTAYILPNILEFVMIVIKGLAKVPFEGDNVNVFGSLESFLDKEEDSQINPEFVQGDINSLYRAVALARFCIVLCNATYKQTGVPTNQKEAIVNSLLDSFTLLEIILERLRSRLPAGSIGRETARKDLEETYKYHVQIVKELFDQSTETSNFPEITQELLDRMNAFAQRLPKSDYPQQPEEPESSVESTAVQQQEKSAESAQSTAEAALKIGAELAMSSAALTAANVLSLELIDSMKIAMNSFADFERFQLAEIQKAEQIAEANNYYSDSTSEEKKELINRLLKVLPSDLAAEFMQHFSNEEIKETGVVMSYNPESDIIRVNYALLRAMFIDESSKDIKNINLFKVFVRHELKHREFAKSSNPLYKAVHAISALEEFFVSMGDISILGRNYMDNKALFYLIMIYLDLYYQMRNISVF
jgi:hypothetical protein